MKKSLVQGAQLWDHDASCGRARDWCLNGAGSVFLLLPNSQMSGLAQAVAGAASGEEFEKRAEKYLNDLAKRQKRESLAPALLAEAKAAVEEALVLKGTTNSALQRRVLNGLQGDAAEVTAVRVNDFETLLRRV